MANGKKSDEDKKSEVMLMQYDKTPDFIDGEMHDYQIRGLNWLISLCENGIGGILGDEMGLGEFCLIYFFDFRQFSCFIWRKKQKNTYSNQIIVLIKR